MEISHRNLLLLLLTISSFFILKSSIKTNQVYSWWSGKDAMIDYSPKESINELLITLDKKQLNTSLLTILKSLSGDIPFRVAHVTQAIGDLIQSQNDSINFIQVGACDGNASASNDPLQKMLLSSTQFHGVMIEPVPYLFEKLKQNLDKHVNVEQNRILSINAALTTEETDGTKAFYMVEKEKIESFFPSAPHWLKNQIGSFDANHIKKHFDWFPVLFEGKDYDEYIKEISVDGLTPQTILKKYRDSGLSVGDGKIHFLLIDAEGFDDVILDTFLKVPDFLPTLIYFESKHIPRERLQKSMDLLDDLGYFVQKLRDDVFALRLSVTVTM